MKARPPVARTGAGLLLVALGVLLWASYHVVGRGEAHSYTDGKLPPPFVTLHAGDRYALGYSGGRPAVARAGLSPAALRCSATSSGGDPSELRLTVEASGTKAVNQIASFEAPFGGLAHVTCTGLSPVYVDDASGDPSGYLLIAAMLLLAIGLPVLLSAARLVFGASDYTDDGAAGYTDDAAAGYPADRGGA